MSDDYLKASKKFMLEDLARSGLVPEDMGCIADEVCTETKAEKRRLITASYLIPFYGLDGSRLELMWRRRRQIYPGAESLKDLGKYTQPHTTMAGGQGSHPYVPPAIWSMPCEDGVLHICEGEKKTASVVKLAGVRAVGIAGKDVSKKTVSYLAEIVRKLGDIGRICIWPDADVQRFDVVRSYGHLRGRLLDALYDVPGLSIDVIQPSWDVRKYKGIDDALTGGWKFTVGQPVGEELPIDIKGLADQIGLDYSTGAKGDSFNLTIHEDNICRTIEHTPLWGELSMNRDNGRWLSGDTELQPEVEVMTFTRRLQRVFGMRKVGSDLVGKCVDHVCRLRERSPWADWLSGLEWDGVPRVDNWLQRACGAAAGDSFISEAGAKWLVGIVARTMRPGVAVDWMLILSGPQGCGKSSLPRALMPEGFESLVMLSPHTQDKDLQQAAGMCRILCFDEMATFFVRKDDQEFIKQFVTATEDVYRPAYGRAAIRTLRGSVLYGSTNKADVIRADESGYRRWVVIGTKGVVDTQYGEQFDWAWLAEHRDQLWAEAVALWRGGLDFAQVVGARVRARDAVALPPEWDDYMVLIGADLKHVGFLLHQKDGTVRVPMPGFKLAYQTMFGRPPNERTLTSFWDYWGCITVKGGGGVRSRVLSAKLFEELSS